MSSQAPPYEGLGKPISGPRALTEDRSRLWHLSYNIARNEFKLKFYGSVLGYVWQVMRPLMLFGVLYVFFVVIGKVGSSGKPGEDQYGVQLLGSIILFGFFNEATSGAVRSVVDRENIVRKIQFPRLAIPLSLTILAFFNLMLNLVVVLIFALISGVHPMWTWLELPLILALLAVFSTGIAMLLSAMFVSFRDIQPIWEVFSQILFYASPLIIPLETVREKIGHGKRDYIHVGRGGHLVYKDVTFFHVLYHIYLLNPMVLILQQFRHAMVNPKAISPAAAMGGWLGVLGPIAVVVVVFAIGFVVFNRSAPHIAENL